MQGRTIVPCGLEPGMVQGSGPMNMFHHFSAFPDATFTAVVRPNFDTLYSIAWLDLTKGPMIVSAPDTKGRYYMLPMLDMWTDVIAVPGKRTSGTNAGRWAVVPQGWTGTLPEGVDRIDVTTPYIWIIGRTQTNGPRDYESVHEVQAGYTVTPLSQWGRPPQAVAYQFDPTVDMKTPPLDQVNNMSGEDFFTYAAELMRVNAPHVTDWSIIARVTRIGIEAGKALDYDKLHPVVKNALAAAPAEALSYMKASVPTLGRSANGWKINATTMGVYGNDYLTRAIVAMIGLGANPPGEAVYPLNIADSDGQPMNGDNNYVPLQESDRNQTYQFRDNRRE